MSLSVKHQMYRFFACVGVTLLLGILALPALVAQSPTLYAHEAQSQHMQRPNDGVSNAVTIDGPAVVRIIEAVNAVLTCHGCAADGSDIISPDPSTGNPYQYYVSGSGAFITPDGYVLTADHVVDHSMNNPEDVSFVEQQAAPDIASRYNTTADVVSQFFQNHPDQVSIQFQTIFQKAYLSTDYTGDLTSTSQAQAFDISSIASSSPVLQQDTAVVKVSLQGIPDVPYLAIAAPNSINVGDTVTAIAYPADADYALNGADFTALFNPSSSDVNTINSLLGPSVNTGQVTKKDTRSDGTDVYEASSISSQGSSGGPIINTQGQIIGFVDAGPSTDRLTFLIPSEVIAKYTQQAGVSNPAQGQFMKQWTQAMQEYYSTSDCHWHNSASDLQKLHTSYPLFGGEQQYLQKATTQEASETCASSGGSAALGGVVLLVLCLVGLLIIAAVIFLIVFLVRRGRKPAAQPAMAPVAAGTAQFGAPMPSQAPYTQPAPMSQAPQVAQGPQSYQSPYSGVPANAPTILSSPGPLPSAPAQPYQAPYSAPPAGPAPVRVAGPQPSQPPMTPQPLQGPQTPLPPSQPGYGVYAGPTQQSGAPQQPYAAPYGATPQGQAPTQPPTVPSSDMTMRYCFTGHQVIDPSATFCPICGSPIRPPDNNLTTTPNPY